MGERVGLEADEGYAALLARGAQIAPGVRLGRPGRSRLYWITIALMRLLRLHLRVELSGAEHLHRGRPAILVANHVSTWDPVCVVISGWWRVTAFTKVEYFASRGSFFFRWMGQIPLRRGDADSTAWALRMAQDALAQGGMLGLYPEGTRSPDGRLHKLHKRILVPMLQANPDVPVHAVTMSYRRHGRRTLVTGRISAPIDLDRRTADAETLTGALTDALLALGGQDYVDEYAQTVKRRRDRHSAGQLGRDSGRRSRARSSASRRSGG